MWSNSLVRLLHGAFGIWWLTAEDKALCREVYTEYLRKPPAGGNWIASRYGRNGWNFAKCIGGEGGTVRLCRWTEPPIILKNPARFQR